MRNKQGFNKTLSEVADYLSIKYAEFPATIPSPSMDDPRVKIPKAPAVPIIEDSEQFPKEPKPQSFSFELESDPFAPFAPPPSLRPDQISNLSSFQVRLIAMADLLESYNIIAPIHKANIVKKIQHASHLENAVEEMRAALTDAESKTLDYLNLIRRVQGLMP